MKRTSWNCLLRTSLFVVVAGACLSASANDGLYIGAEGGINFEPDQTLTDHSGGPGTARLHFRNGVVGGLNLGYSFVNGLRPELGLDFRRNRLDKFDNGVVFTDVDGHEELYTAMGNLWYDIKTPTGFFSVVHPYLGAGIGWGRLSLRNPRIGVAHPLSSFDSALAWQFGAGIGYDLTRRWTLSADYRYVRTRTETLTPGSEVDARYRAHSAMLGVRYSFGGQPEPVAEPVRVAPPPPPPPAIDPCAGDSDHDGVPDCRDKCPGTPKGFKVDANGCIVEQSLILRSVNFVYNSDQLTVPAQDTLTEVAQALIGQPALNVRIVGHTDSIGSSSYNLRLSQRRAESVRRYLMLKGVNQANLQAAGMGKTKPIASNSTEEGRAENRRVEFVVVNKPANVNVKSADSTARSKEAAESGEPTHVKKKHKKKK
jgi:OOP family OmpA-OmpF porin